MKVWIDQDLCTGDGLCEEIAPDVFTLLDDGLAYVKEGDKVFSDPGGAEGLANVPAGQDEADDRVRRGVPRRVHLHRGRVARPAPGRRAPAHRGLRRRPRAASGPPGRLALGTVSRVRQRPGVGTALAPSGRRAPPAAPTVARA